MTERFPAPCKTPGAFFDITRHICRQKGIRHENRADCGKDQYSWKILWKEGYRRAFRATAKKKYGFEKVDVFVLFGGSILAGGDVLAKAVRENIAKNYVIVGGRESTKNIR